MMRILCTLNSFVTLTAHNTTAAVSRIILTVEKFIHICNQVIMDDWNKKFCLSGECSYILGFYQRLVSFLGQNPENR